MGNRRLNYILFCLLGAVLLLAVVLFGALFRYDRQTSQTGTAVAVEVMGEYSEEGGPWQPLTRETFFQNLKLRDITVRGHFTREIPKGASLFLNIDHMWVVMRVNGEKFFSIGPVEGDGNPTHAMGKQWVTVTSPGISEEDTVELQFGNTYRNAYMIQFDELLWQMHTGDVQAMMLRAIQMDGWTLGVGAIFLCLTLAILTAAIGCAVIRMEGARYLLWLGLFTLFAALWFFTLSPALTMFVPLPVFLNVLYAFSMQALATFLVLFVMEHLSGWRRWSLKACVGLLILLMLVGLVNQILRIHDLYSAINYFSIFDLLIALWMVYCIGYEAYKKKRPEAKKLLMAMLPLAVAAVAELVNGYFQFSKAAILLGLGLVAFTVMEGGYTMGQIKRSMDSEKWALLLEQELSRSRISTMRSQIQPHFLYNTLNTIRQLCRTEPERASDIIFDFSKYLQGNMDSLTQEGVIPFEEELAHTMCYLSIEQARFPDLKIEYDLRAQSFSLPPLTLQPLVENAVRHGAAQRKWSDGTVIIATWEDADAFYLRVEDNGAGFDATQPRDDGESHIGIANTRGRLQTICRGTLAIETAPYEGTAVTITLPKAEPQ